MRTSFWLRQVLAAIVTFGGVLLSAHTMLACEQEKSENTATTPAPRDPNWVKRHEGFVEIAKKGGVDVLFLGDSITDSWRAVGRDVWQKHFEPLKAANFGISGDRTQHVLWRLAHGELDGITPKVAVLMIGTNNSNGADNTAEEIAAGVTAIVKTIREKSPKTNVLLLAVFPRGEKPNPQRDKINKVNAAIAKLDDGKTIRYLDIGPKFLQPDGSISKEIMPDFLHLTPKGYEIWADAITPTLKQMLAE